MRGRRAVICAVSVVATAAFLSLGAGRFEVTLRELWTILCGCLSPQLWDGPLTTKARLVLLVRAPRVLLALLSGCGLGVSGAALQGIFRNPLASPDVLGVTYGAAFGGVLAITFFDSALATIITAFIAGLLSIVLVFSLSRTNGRASVLTLVLAGMVCGAFFSAMISLVKFMADPLDKLPGIVFWLMGSLSSATWARFFLVLPPIAAAVAAILLLRFQVNLLSLGDEEAALLRVKVEMARWLVLICSVTIAAACVSVCGIIGWVGLVVPHAARLLVGPDHRRLIPMSMLCGAIFVLLADDLARTVTAAELPIGIITATVGAPAFLLLLRRHGVRHAES